MQQLNFLDTQNTSKSPDLQLPRKREFLAFSKTKLPKPVITALESGTATLKESGDYHWFMPQMQPKHYQEFKQILQALRGTWTGSVHIFPVDPTPHFERILREGKLPEVNPNAFFPTPVSAIETMFALMDLPQDYLWLDRFELQEPEPASAILEPHGGSGNIALAAKKRLQNAQIDTCELDGFNREILSGLGFNLVGDDFLKLSTQKKYDFVLANPPFQGLEFTRHIMKMHDHLKPGGRIGTIAPNFLWKTDKKSVEFRNWVAARGYWESVGSPFEDTKIECLALRISHMTQAELDRDWMPSSGYRSKHQEMCEIALDCEPEWQNLYADLEDRKPRDAAKLLGKTLDSLMDKLIGRERNALVFDQRVRQQIVESALDELEINVELELSA